MRLSQLQIDALGHIVDHCRKAGELAGRFATPESLAADWEAQYALIRCVEVIGEASTRLGPQFHGEYPEVPWRLITGMRNRLIHGYDQVEMDLLWETATRDLPVLLPAVEAMLQAEMPGGDPTSSAPRESGDAPLH